MTKELSITDDQFDLMHILEKYGRASQRLLSQNTVFIIGKVIHCI